MKNPIFFMLRAAVFLGLVLGDVQAQNFSNTIWAGTLTGKTKELAHYRKNEKGPSVTGATANQVPAEIWFPSGTNFCVVFNNRNARASDQGGDRGILVYDAHLYDLVVGQNPAPSNPMLDYWAGTGTVDTKRRQLTGNSQTEDESVISVMNVVATYRYKKSGSIETLTVSGTSLMPVQKLDSFGDGWKLNPGVVTYTGTFTKTTNKVSIEGFKRGMEGF